MEKIEAEAFQMFSDAGNYMCKSLTESLIALANKQEKEFMETLKKGFQEICQAGHTEVNDTEPEWAIVEYLREFTQFKGLERRDLDRRE